MLAMDRGRARETSTWISTLRHCKPLSENSRIFWRIQYDATCGTGCPNGTNQVHDLLRAGIRKRPFPGSQKNTAEFLL